MMYISSSSWFFERWGANRLKLTVCFRGANTLHNDLWSSHIGYCHRVIPRRHLTSEVLVWVWHCLCDTVHALDCTCLQESAAKSLNAPREVLFFSFPLNWSSLIVQGKLFFECRGLVNMNYSQSGLRIPHGHCFWLKLEVHSPLSNPWSIYMECTVIRML